MRLSELLNADRVNALQVEHNAYVNNFKSMPKNDKVQAQTPQKVVFPEPYENASPYYNKTAFDKPCSPEPPPQHNSSQNHSQQHNMPMFDIKSLLPMLMSGKLDVLKPLMSLFGGSGGGSQGMDFGKIFELFKPKPKQKKDINKEEDISSKFDDMIIIED